MMGFIIEGIITYVVTRYFLAAMILTTTTSDTILTNILPIGIAAGVVISSLGIKGIMNRGGGE